MKKLIHLNTHAVPCPEAEVYADLRAEQGWEYPQPDADTCGDGSKEEINNWGNGEGDGTAHAFGQGEGEGEGDGDAHSDGSGASDDDWVEGEGDGDGDGLSAPRPHQEADGRGDGSTVNRALLPNESWIVLESEPYYCYDYDERARPFPVLEGRL